MAKKAAEEGIKIYTVGIGTEKGKPIPMRVNGIFSGYKKDLKGDMVISKRHIDMLKTIAKEGNGVFMDGNITDKPVKYMEDVIVNAQKNKFESKQFSDYKDQFQWFVAIALLILILDSFMLEKKTQWLKTLDLFNEQK